MPRGNGMGPDNMGPGTGRRMGYCAGYDRPGCYNYFEGGSRGRRQNAGFSQRAYGGRRGPGYGGRFNFPGFESFRRGFDERDNAGELDFLKNQAEDLETELAAVQERIRILEEDTSIQD